MNGAATVKGLVVSGSRNIFTVRVEDETAPPALRATLLECRIKGKVLKDTGEVYNPLAAGDRVIVEPDAKGGGLILALEERRNKFSRFNQKGNLSQLLASNVDLALCLATPASPPFRPRFLDRALLQADAAGITPLIVCNKSDLSVDDPDIDERLEDFSRAGYSLLRVSAKTGMGLDELRSLIAGKTSVLIGQSGVGKSSLINALLPELNIRTGSINEKYDRGSHTTTMSVLIEFPLTEAAGASAPTRLIDTPGIRRFVPDGVAPDEIILYMREFAPLAGKCTYGLSCSHRVEPGCKVMEAVAAGVVHEDRYDSFLRIHDELSGRNDVD
jgi:ribosome biogenesis GTPase